MHVSILRLYKKTIRLSEKKHAKKKRRRKADANIPFTLYRRDDRARNGRLAYTDGTRSRAVHRL